MINELAERLDLVTKARQNAKADAPMSGMVPVIVAAAQEEGKKEIHILREHREDAEVQITALQKALAGADAKLDNPDYGPEPSRAHVDRAEHRLKAAEAEYNAFKQDNGIIGVASGDDRFFRMGIAIIVVIFEGVFNSLFFAPAFEHGLIGGFIAAFLVGLVNVGFAFAGGVLGLRYVLHHNKAHANLFGMVVFCACILVCAGTVALSSYFRANVDLLLLQEDTDILKLSQTAWDRSLEDMRQVNLGGLFASLNSFLLVFVGAICAFVGMWEGYEFDDRYPGFGRMERSRAYAQEEFEEADRAYQQQLNDWRGDKSKMLAEIKEGLGLVYDQARVAVSGLADVSMDAGNLPANTKQLAQGALNFYCSAYQGVASGSSPVPADISDEPFAFLAQACRDHGDKVAKINHRFEESEQDYFKIK